MPNTYSQVSSVINRVSQDVRLQLSAANATPGQPILIDYTNRIHKQMLRFSRWEFLRSETQYFMTVKGQTDYWIGPTGSLPPGMVNTNLNLTDVDRIQKDSVRDITNNNQLFSLGAQPISNGFNFRSGQNRQGRPGNFWQDHNDVNILHIYTAPDNTNPYQPVPNSPIVTSSVSGALPSRSYFVVLTFVDSIGGESSSSQISVNIKIPANSVLNVASPTLPFNQTSTGVTYGFYNVYVGTAEGSETKQNVAPIALGTNFVEPNTGLTTNGGGVPITNTLEKMGGYIIQFRYYKARAILQGIGDTLQIPDDYLDVVVNGVSALTWKLLGRADDAAAAQALYRAGLTEMVWDKNLFPNQDFIRPDPATYVNIQNMGVMPSTNE